MALTPDGTKLDPVDPSTANTAWISPTSHPNLVKFAADATKSDFLNEFILDACAAINRICNRKFNKQQIDQIFKDTNLFFRDYKTFVLDNRPLISVDNMWIQVVDTFSPISLEFIQVMTREAAIKVLPNFSSNVQTTLPIYALESSTNLWVRYTSGYEVDQDGGTNEVPRPVQQATALYVSYLFSSFDVDSGISEFKTQTYQQKNVLDADKDPLLTRIDKLLNPYIIRNAR